MAGTDHDPDSEQSSPVAQARPGWVDAAVPVPDNGRLPRPRRIPRDRAPVPGRHEEDGLWEHVLVTGLIAALLTFFAAVALPHTIPLWMISSGAATVAAVTWWESLRLSGSMAMCNYLGAWGVVLAGWLTAARLEGPWHAPVIFALILPVGVLIPSGVTVIRRHRDRVKHAMELGRETANTREMRHWHDLLLRFGITGATIRDVMKVDGGYRVHGQLGKYNADGHKPSSMAAIRELAPAIAVHKRLTKGAVYIEEEPAGLTAADFFIHVHTARGPRLTQWLPADNSYISVNDEFPLGVFDTGKTFRLRLRELVLFICGVRGSGKSTLLNIIIAQLCRTPDTLIWVIDLKGGQESRAWLIPWLLGHTDRPVIDWLATTREEADVMLDAAQRAGEARAARGGHGRKLRPSPDFPAIIILCDETTNMTGHQIREDGLSNTKLAVKLVRLAEMFRSVAIDPVVSTVRAVVENTGSSGLKAMAEARIGMKVATAEEGRSIFPDDLAAAKQLAQLKDKGSGIPKINGVLSPPVHFFNITDGTDDDDGNPTEDRITPIVLATTKRRPKPERLIVDAMGEAYTKRWKQDAIVALTDAWKATAVAAGAHPGAIAVAMDGDPEDFDQMLRNDPMLQDLNRLDPSRLGRDGEDSQESARPDYQSMNPTRKKMYELLIDRGSEGWRVGLLWGELLNDGHDISRGGLHAWLKDAEQLGYVVRGGHKWRWRLPEGREFDIPGWE